MSTTAPVDVSSPEAFLNRDRSWLEFNARVLAQARDLSLPLLERVRFLAIASSNLDEFFMVQVADVWRQLESGVVALGVDGMSPSEELTLVRERVNTLHAEQYACLTDELLPALEAQRISVLHHHQLSERQQAEARAYFERSVFPVVTPLALGPTQPFPFISNLSLNLLVMVDDVDFGIAYARVKIPDTLPRFVPVQSDRSDGARFGEVVLTWLEEVVVANLQRLFPGTPVVQSYPFRVVRDADVEFANESNRDLLSTIEATLRQRHFGGVVQIEFDYHTPRDLRQELMRNLDLDERDMYDVRGPLGLASLFELYQLERADLKYTSLVPRIPSVISRADDIFGAIRQQDILLHHPYESYSPVVDFIRAAATDPDVLAIKQTLYRVGRDSPIVAALMTAREKGKQVAVLVELRARFDEEHNIEWARAFDKAGVHVVHGLLGLKTHAKIALVVRRERDGLRRYVHLGTGNYNATTARQYTDFSLFTCDEDFGADASDFFNSLTGYSRQENYRVFTTSPHRLRARMHELVQREIELCQRGERGNLIFKMNAITDPEMIRLLYQASSAGVKIDLLVRGMCTLRPGFPGLSDNIRVFSVVGRFLEHARAYYFWNGGKEEVYLSSADLRPRNLDRRVELFFPIRDQSIVRRMRDEILENELNDTMRSAQLTPDGSYVPIPVPEDVRRVDSQEVFLQVAPSYGTE